MSDEKIVLIFNTIKKISIIIVAIGSAIISCSNAYNKKIDETDDIQG